MGHVVMPPRYRDGYFVHSPSTLIRLPRRTGETTDRQAAFHVNITPRKQGVMLLHDQDRGSLFSKNGADPGLIPCPLGFWIPFPRNRPADRRR